MESWPAWSMLPKKKVSGVSGLDPRKKGIGGQLLSRGLTRSKKIGLRKACGCVQKDKASMVIVPYILPTQ